MKKLIFPLILVPFLALANEMQEHDNRVKTKFLTVVKEVEVEKLVGSASEFNECRDFFKTDKAKAEACFENRLGSKKGPALKKLAEDLKLQEYGLIKSTSVRDITEYLGKKFRKSLLGYSDPKDLANQKWEDKKIVDQKVFIELYKNQLAKNSLYEISRFCFEDFRLEISPAATDFASYWGGTVPLTDDNGVVSPAQNVSTLNAHVSQVSDIGGDQFFKGKLDKSTDLNDEKAVYEKLISGLTPAGKNIDAAFYGKFFFFCNRMIKPLCDNFKKTATASAVAALATAPAASPAGSAATSAATTPIPSKMTKGASACLTINKLEDIRTTLRNTEKVEKQFKEMEDKGTFAIQMLRNPNLYKNGQGQGEESFDELTSVASSDFLKSGEEENEKMADLQKQCENGNGGDDCEKFLDKGDSLDNAMSEIEMNLQLKKKIEVARVKELNGKDLATYLEENRHFDLLAKHKDKTLSDADIAVEIEKFYEAKKAAELEAMKFRLGKRQINEAEDKALVGQARTDQINNNITDSKEERARLAQLVMFNNIITSTLELSKDLGGGKSKAMGRNVSGWNKEKAGLDGIQGINQDLFEGIQDSADKHGVKTKESIADVGFLDLILGVDTSKED